jgi:hypothetical protein
MQIGKESGARIQEPGGGGVWAYRRVGEPVDEVDLVDGVDGVERGEGSLGVVGSRLPGAFTALFLNIGACRLDRMGKR